MTRRLRNQAALLCSAMASRDTGDVFVCWTDIRDMLGISDSAWVLALQALNKSCRDARTLPTDVHLWAEAEAMLRTGEV